MANIIVLVPNVNTMCFVQKKLRVWRLHQTYSLVLQLIILDSFL